MSIDHYIKYFIIYYSVFQARFQASFKATPMNMFLKQQYTIFIKLNVKMENLPIVI